MSFLDRLLRRPAAPSPSPREHAPGGVPTPDQPRELVLYAFQACPYCQRVFRAADDLGLRIPVRDTRRDPEASRALRALTGGTQVPCLVIDGQPLLESADIVQWLRQYKERGAAGA